MPAYPLKLQRYPVKELKIRRTLFRFSVAAKQITPKLSAFKQPRLLLLTSVSWLGPDRVGSSSAGLPGGLAEDPGQVAAGAGVAGPLPVQVARPAGDPGFCL